MKKKINIKIIFFYMLIDVLCMGAGMGVPFFCILLGFPLGWYLANKVPDSNKKSHKFRQILKWSFLASVFTFVQMVFVWIVWGGMLSALSDPSFDFQNFGHPLILFDPKASFIGWLILMVFISPFLQLLTTIFGSFIFLASSEYSKN